MSEEEDQEEEEEEEEEEAVRIVLKSFGGIFDLNKY
jgi:hypothetical protein